MFTVLSCSSPSSCSRKVVIVSQSLSSDPATCQRLSTRYAPCSWNCQENGSFSTCLNYYSTSKEPGEVVWISDKDASWVPIWQRCFWHYTGRKPHTRPKASWSNYISWLSQCLSVTPEELEEVAVDSKLWASPWDCCPQTSSRIWLD